ncbi:MAG TPA: VWA domain-containing protein [Kofleriaceae bacterium]|nr:VWA domain-containing protein [Kofleriaceae bacterium]
MTFVTPHLLWVAAGAPLALLALHLYDRARRRQLTSRLGELAVIGKVIGSASPGRRVGKDLLVAIAAALIAIAAARPQISGTHRIELRGLDLVVAVDVSKSMLVDDVGPTAEMARKHLPTSRLARARELASEVIEELPGDRIAPVVFAGAAAHFPLTEDHLVATNFLHDLGPGDLSQGSNLGEVFRVARCLLRPDLYEDLGCARIGRRGHGGDPLPGETLDPRSADRPADPKADAGDPAQRTTQSSERGKAIVVFTDGGDPDADAQREVAAARELGIAVFLVGEGSAAGGVVYEIDGFTGVRTTTPKKLPDGATVTSKRDDAGMKALAALSGDDRRYLVAAEHGEVDPAPIVEALRGINRGLATKRVKDRRDVYQPFLFAGLMLLVIEIAISTRRRQRYPEAA